MRRIAIMKDCTEQEIALLKAAAQPDDKFFYFQGKQDFQDCEEKEQIEIVFGEPGYNTILAMKSLRWIQMSWAGANKYTAMEAFPSHITLTSASGAFGGIISEHILAGILTLYKNLRPYQYQLWQGGWQLLRGDDTLEEKRVLILGTGNIGLETAKKLKAFGAYTVGICRTQREKPAYFDECYTIESLDAQLPKADVAIVALPGTKETAGMFSAERIGKMQKEAIFVNVGRGFIVDTQALTEALEQGKIRGAVLDVTDPEPLPADHKLRFMENVVLTPHVSGISWGDNPLTKQKILDIFCENLKADAKGCPLRNIIDFQHGY